jgi:hypothetical protein
MKARTVVAVAVSAFVVWFGMAVTRADHDKPGQIDPDHDSSRVQTGFEYAKQQGIKLNLDHRDRGLVGLGSYLVNAVGGCNDCHTAGANPNPPYTKDPYAFLGAPKQVDVACYLAGGAPFGPPPFGLPPGSPVSRDITPFEGGKPAGLTFDQFKHVLRTGEDPDNPGHVLRVMPWPVYQSLTDHDLRAIYEYLSSIPPIAQDTCGVPSV